MRREREPCWPAVFSARDRLESYRPGGWWRHDVLLQILAALHPRWATSAEITRLIHYLRPDRRRPWHASVKSTAQALGRLHGRGLVDRYGTHAPLAGKVKGSQWKTGFILNPRRVRYRLRRDA